MIFTKSGGSETIRDSRDLAEYLGVDFQSLAGVSVNSKTALGFSPVFSCIRAKAEDVGKLPWNFMERKQGRKDIAAAHRLYSLLHDAPNDFMTSQEWREMIVAHIELRGKHFSYINRVNGEVREFLPLNPDKVEKKVSNNWEVSWVVTMPNGDRVPLDNHEILYIPSMTVDGSEGLSTITQNKNSIGLGLAAEKYGSQLFKNNSRPSGYLKATSKMEKAQKEENRQYWEEINGGDNALKTAILSGGMEWVQVSISPEDAQFLETRKYNRSEICGVFRVPPHKIGDLDNATFSNIEHQAIEYVQDAILPLVRRIESRIQLNVLKPSERKRYFSKINVNGLLRGDSKSRAEYYTRMLQNGALSPNEIRELEDMNPRDGGDVYLTPMNMAINGKPLGESDDKKAS